MLNHSFENKLALFSFLLRIIVLGITHFVRTQNFRKTNISYPLMRTRTCVYQGVRNVSFSENFAYVLNE